MTWMSEEQAAAALGVPFKTIRRRVGNGSLPSKRQGTDLLVNIELARVEEEKKSSDQQPGLALEPIPPIAPIPGTTPRTISPPRAPSMIPTVVPKLHLAAATLNHAHAQPGMNAHPQAVPSSQPQSVVTAELHTFSAPSRPKPRWMELTIWVLLTLLLSTGAISGWLLHDTRQRLQEADNRLTQALASSEQTRLDGIRELTASKAAAAKQEMKLQAELESARARVAELTTQVQKYNQAAADLSSALDLATSRLASMAAQKHELSNRLTLAQASLTALNWKADLSGVISGWVTQLGQGHAGASPATSLYGIEFNSAADQGSALADNENPPNARIRELPPAAPSLAKEDLAIKLRPIVQE